MKEVKTITKEELKNINPGEIGHGIKELSSDVEAQGYIIHCECGQQFHIRHNFRITICPFCGVIKEWKY